MDQATKAKFILALHKHSLQAFDSGGTVLSGPAPAAQSPGGIMGAIGNFLGTNPQSPNIQQGTNSTQLNNAYTGAQSGLTQGQQLADLTQGQGTQGAATQTGLTNTLNQEVAGQGPNPAQAALNQATGANVANQAALMAGQRGASSNPALLARQAAMQGASTQQQAVGQGATLQAQQRLAAQQQLQQLAATQVGQNAGAVGAVNQEQQGEQQILQGANQAANNNAVGAQDNINNHTMSTGSVLGGITSGLSSLAGFAGSLGGAGSTGSTTTLAGGSGDAGTAAGATYAARGGMIRKMAVGGDVDSASLAYPMPMLAKGGMPNGPRSRAAQWLKGAAPQPMLAATGGKVIPKDLKEKATKKGNSLANDKVPAMLSEGEIVIPRSITMHPMAAQKAAQFVQAALNKRKMGKAA